MTPIQNLAGLAVGTVESVSPSEVRIALDIDAPASTALNTGSPNSFPRINGYVLIPNESGATVGVISWIGIERSQYPKRSGLKDFGIVDLPFPLRVIRVNPLGTLKSYTSGAGMVYELARGVTTYPSAGDQVLLPSTDQIAAIVGGTPSPSRQVSIGVSSLSANTQVKVDPDRLFGRHLAVLGNTGSGKSCSVAGLIRWSVEAATKAKSSAGRPGLPNQRFIVLDPNGEYSRAFQDIDGGCRIFRVEPETDHADTTQHLVVPAWLWNGHEWSSVANAQPGVQRPLLMQALRDLKGGTGALDRRLQIRRYISTYRLQVRAILNAGATLLMGQAGQRRNCGEMLENLVADLNTFMAEIEEGDVQNGLAELEELCNEVIQRRKSGVWFNNFTVTEFEEIFSKVEACEVSFGTVDEPQAASEDSPIPFDIRALPAYLERLANAEGGNVAGFASTMQLRIRSMLADSRLRRIIESDPPPTLVQWLESYIGNNNAANGAIAVVDLSLVPSEVIAIVVSVLGRTIFEALQRYRRENRQVLPTVLVLEEAHSFIRHSKTLDGELNTPTNLCREVFEKIAREGRKFGLGLVLSSQRPSELSPTVLAQCNTFLLHRLVNDRDQDLVGRLIPDNLGGLLSELPSLPSRQAILLGWATSIPILLEIHELSVEHRPHSSDPDFWNVWVGESAREVDWAPIADGWT